MSATTVRDDIGDMPAEFETIEEAIAEAMRQLDSDGVVVIHAAECDHDGEDEDSCTCEPLELKLGASS